MKIKNEEVKKLVEEFGKVYEEFCKLEGVVEKEEEVWSKEENWKDGEDEMYGMRLSVMLELLKGKD